MTKCSFECGNNATVDLAQGAFCDDCYALAVGRPTAASIEHNNRRAAQPQRSQRSAKYNPDKVPDNLQIRDMFSMKPKEQEFRMDLTKASELDVRDERGDWYLATVKRRRGEAVYISYIEWADKYNRWYHISSKALAPPFSKSTKQSSRPSASSSSSRNRGSRHRGIYDDGSTVASFPTDGMSAEEKKWRKSLSVGDMIDSRDTEKKWYLAEVKAVNDSAIYLRYTEWSSKFNIWKHRTDPTLAMPFTQSVPRGQHGKEVAVPKPKPKDIPDYANVAVEVTEGNVKFQSVPLHVLARSSGGKQGRFHRIRMPPDNSCLFHSISYVCEGKGTASRDRAMVQRKRIMLALAESPNVYTEAILGKPPAEYIAEMSDMNKWGGYIELTIFSALYAVEIYAFDIQGPGLYRFGEDKGYDKRVFIMYYGQHYDAIVYQEDGKDELQEFFDVQDENTLNMIKQYVEILHLAEPKNTEKPQSEVTWRGRGISEVSHVQHISVDTKESKTGGEQKNSVSAPTASNTRTTTTTTTTTVDGDALEPPPLQRMESKVGEDLTTPDEDGDDSKLLTVRPSSRSVIEHDALPTTPRALRTKSQVIVSVISGRSLCSVVADELVDPYCKVGLKKSAKDINMLSGSFKTDIVRECMNPDWGLYNFTFNPMVKGKTHDVIITCLDKERFTSNFLGQVTLTLNADVKRDVKMVKWFDLKPKHAASKQKIRGKLLISILWEPTDADYQSLVASRTWICAACTFQHEVIRPTCEMCGADRPIKEKQSTTNRIKNMFGRRNSQTATPEPNNNA